MKLRMLFIGVCALLVSSASAQKTITQEMIWASYKFYAQSVDEVNSMKDGEHYTVLERDRKSQRTSIDKYSYKTFEKVGTLVSSDDLVYEGKPIGIEGYSFSSDEKFLLIETDIEMIYRRSYMANYFVYNLENKKLERLADPAKGKQTLAEFSPDGLKIAFVRNNNIYVHYLADGREQAVTTDGERNKIINGTTDWVYEEEFAITKGFYWAPDSDHLAYYKFDESHVHEYTIDFYGELYPTPYRYKYPKAGEDNSEIRLFVCSVGSENTREVDLGTDKDIYIPRISWTSTSRKLCVLRLNRLQNNLEYALVDIQPKGAVTDMSLHVFHTDKSDTYVEITDDLYFLENDRGLIRTSEKDGYNHLYRVDFEGNVKQITSGNWDVVAFKGYDEDSSWVYYTSAEESAIHKALYRVKTDGSNKQKLSSRKGSNDAVFSQGMKYYINYYSNANTPTYVTLHQAWGKELKVLQDNKEVVKNLKDYMANPKEFFTFKTSEGIELNGWMIKPAGFKEKKKYPVFLTYYGGPGKNEVEDDWGGATYMWHQMLAQQGYLVVCVDPRGTQFRGAKFKKCTYLQLGKYETVDLIETAKYLGGLSYVDKSRIGCQGWSYGGYMTLLLMTRGAAYFKTGIAVAPVTNWRYYDNIYTERFMRKPQDNGPGYDENSPVTYVDKLKGKLLVVHGSADDNVHMQNTMEFADRCIEKNIPFDMFIYPNKNHGIYGGYTRLHLFSKMTSYLLTNL